MRIWVRHSEGPLFRGAAKKPILNDDETVLIKR